MEKAHKFGYYEPSIGVTGRVCCRDCKHTLNCDGTRTYGVVKTLSINDKDFGKLCLICKEQDGYVRPYAWCDKAEAGKCQLR